MIFRARFLFSFTLILLLSISSNSFAEIAGFPFASPEQEQRFRELSEELRCLVCQNQSLADSNAGLAKDLRTELYDQIIEDNSDEEIIRFMTDRYGEFVLYKPRFTVKTLFLWLTPFCLLLIAIVSLYLFNRNQASSQNSQNSEDELKRARELLEKSIGKQL